MTRAEWNFVQDVPAVTTGSAEAKANDDDEHGPHSFLYVPDLTMETGWSAHRVPDQKPQRHERREVGFRR